jgi:hypothetical protein
LPNELRRSVEAISVIGTHGYAATLLWLGGFPINQIVPWLAGFVVLTIAGERLEPRTRRPRPPAIEPARGRRLVSRRVRRRGGDG